MVFLVKIFSIIIAWTYVQCIYQRDKVFFLQKSSGEDNETILVVTWAENGDEYSNGCEFFNDKDLISEVLRSSNDSSIRTLSEDEMQNLLYDCTEFTLKRRRRETDDEDEEPEENSLEEDIMNEPVAAARSRSNQRQNGRKNRRRGKGRRTSTSTITYTTTESTNTTRNTNTTEGASTRRYKTTIENSTITQTTTVPTITLGYDGLPIIYPGTKWCGAGAVARNQKDLGMYQDTDRCCRAHDLCDDTLAPGETKYNLTNNSSFTVLSCECDDAFYNCLSEVNSFTSNSIGNIYFNVLRRQCYKKEYPETKKCKRYLTLLKVTCMEYERNRRAPKVYQFIPAKSYKNIPVPRPLRGK